MTTLADEADLRAALLDAETRAADAERKLDLLVRAAMTQKRTGDGFAYLSCRFCLFQTYRRGAQRHDRDRCPLAMLGLAGHFDGVRAT